MNKGIKIPDENFEVTGGSNFDKDPRLAKVLSGLEVNTKKPLRRRFHALSNYISLSPDYINAYDPLGTDPNVLDIFPMNNLLDGLHVATALAYLGSEFSMDQGEKRYFIKKRGVSTIGISYRRTVSTSSDNVELRFNGQTLTALSIKDEDGVVYGSDGISTIGGVTVTRYQETKFFTGFPVDEEIIVEVFNNDSVSKIFYWDSVIVIYGTPPSLLAVGHSDIKLTSGKATVRGLEVDVAGSDLVFEESSGFGRQDILAIDTAGVTSVLKGAEPAMTKVRAGKTVTAGVDSSIPVMSNLFFPEKGICQVSYPFGNSATMSYSSKVQTAIISTYFDGLLWDKTLPAYQALTGLPTGTAGVVGDFHGDIVINLLASAHDGTGLSNAIEIDGSNNKLDFEIQIDAEGSPSAYAITIPSGIYTGSPGYMNIGEAIAKQMQLAKPLPDQNSYFAKYNPTAQTWQIGVKSNGTVVAFSLPFLTGANEANSVHSDLGFFSFDRTGSFDYMAENTKQHEAVKTFDRSGKFRDPSHPNTQFVLVDQPEQPGIAGLQLEQLPAGLSFVRVYNNQEGMVKIMTSPDSVGIEIPFVITTAGTTFAAQIDNGEVYYIAQNDSPEHTIAAYGGRVMNSILTWPRGTKEVVIHEQSHAMLELTSEGVGSNGLTWVGYRELFSHAPLEKLSTTQAAYPDPFDIRAKKLYAQAFLNEFSGVGEKMATPSYSGSFSIVSGGTGIGGSDRRTTTISDYAEATFTINEDGGGIYAGFSGSTNSSRHIELFLIEGGVGTFAADNLIQVAGFSSPTWLIDTRWNNRLGTVGLKAGTYTARWRKADATSAARLFGLEGFTVVDGDETHPDVYRTDDLANDQVSISWPHWGVEYKSMFKDGTPDVPLYLERSGYNTGEYEFDYAVSALTITQPIDAVAVGENWWNWWSSRFTSTGINDVVGFYDEMESAFLRLCTIVTTSPTIQPTIDGVVKSTFSQLNPAKNSGTQAGSTTVTGFPMFKKNFFTKATGNMPDATTIPVTLTDGIRVGSPVHISATGQPTEIRIVQSVTLNTSITLNRGITGFANYTVANGTKLNFGGSHRLKVENLSATNWSLNCWGVLPLPVKTGKMFKDYDQSDIEIATIEIKGVGAGQDLPIPRYKDGSLATFTETIPIVLQGTVTNWQTGFRDVPATAATIRLVSIRRRK